jgi:hypothetical protein
MDSIERGNRAKALLDNEVLVSAFDEIETTTIQLWKGTSDKETRDELWYTLKGMERFKTVLEAAVSSGDYDKQLSETYT